MKRTVSGRLAWSIPGLCAILLLASACYQPAGARDLPPTALPEGFVPPAMTTPLPSEGDAAGAGSEGLTDDAQAPASTPIAIPTTASAPEAAPTEVTPLEPAQIAATATAQALYAAATQIVVQVTQTAAAAAGVSPPTTAPAGEVVQPPAEGEAVIQPAEPPAPADAPAEEAPAAQQVLPDSCVYTVQAGETMFRISQRYGVTVEALAAANNIANPRLIYAGQRLVIPNCQGAPAQPAPQTGGRTHVVQPGETLYRIALRYGTTWQALAAANNLANPNQIFAGQTLTIP